jgi:hypothetical protein
MLTSSILKHSPAVRWYLESSQGRGHELEEGRLAYKLFHSFEMCGTTVLILIQNSFM